MNKSAIIFLSLAAFCLAIAGCGSDGVGEGDVIRDISDEMVDAGERIVYWDQRTNGGESVAPGTYGAWFRSMGFDSTAVFEIVPGESASHAMGSHDPHELRGYEVWTGSEAYVVGEPVDVHVYVPLSRRIRISIVRL
jgi:hypothetical protein